MLQMYVNSRKKCSINVCYVNVYMISLLLRMPSNFRDVAEPPCAKPPTLFPSGDKTSRHKMSSDKVSGDKTAGDKTSRYHPPRRIW